MTNLRTHGFDSPAQLRDYLEDLEDEEPTDVPAQGENDEFNPNYAQREIGWLRKEIADLRERVTATSEPTDAISSPIIHGPWRRLAIAAAAAFLVGRIVLPANRHGR
jgi:hypothetical protein